MSKNINQRSSRKRSSSESSSGGRIESALNSVGLRFLVTAYRVLKYSLSGLFGSSFILALPLLLLLASSLTDYMVLLHALNSATLLFFSALPVQIEDARRADAESLKKSVQAILYLFTLALCVLNWRAVYHYFRKWPHLVLLVIVLLFTATYSSDPTKVVTNSILILISVLMPLLFVIGQRGSHNKLQYFYLLVLIPFLTLHVASLVLLLFYGADPFSIIASPNRYGGFSGNPNAYGNSAALGIWATAALLFSPSIARLSKLLAVLSIPVFVLSILMSGSGTATVASILTVVLMIWMRVLASFKPTVRFAVNVFTAALSVCLALSVLLLVTPAEVFLAFTGSLGKDATMTGRTELWAIAKDAIAERPWFGWSFDSHSSVMEVRDYDVRYNHYHNGFLDTIIDGGFVLLGLVLFNFGRFIQSFIKFFRHEHAIFPLLVPFIMVVVLNLSEYSLLRPLSEVWQLYVACFVIITYQYVESISYAKAPSAKSHRKRKRGMRWA